MGAILVPKTREWRASRGHQAHRAIHGLIVIHAQRVVCLAEVPLEIDSNKLLDGRVAATHLVVSRVSCVDFVDFSSADCRVDPSKLGELSPREKLGNNGPP
jgi:hypothetical protein